MAVRTLFFYLTPCLRIGRRTLVPRSSWKIFTRIAMKNLTVALGFTVMLSSYSLPARGQVQPETQQGAGQSASAAIQTLPSGSAARGKELFTGQTHLYNGGPPCAACHSIAGLAFPNGGTLGPNLTGVYNKLGPQGMQVAMRTLYFHVMTSIYDPHPLTLEERSDLTAFFREAATQPKPRWETQIVALAGFLGFCVLLAVTRYLWRDRLKSVRRRMVEKAVRQGGLHS
jgi:hypothetical protein